MQITARNFSFEIEKMKKIAIEKMKMAKDKIEVRK